MHPVFRPKQRADRMRCAYLNADGSVVVIFERDLRDLGTRQEYVQLAETIGVRAQLQGRIVFHDAALLLAIAGMPGPVTVSASSLSLEHGSDKSRAQGVAVGSVTIRSPVGWFFLHETSLISESFHVQDDIASTFADIEKAGRWGSDTPVARVFRRPPEKDGAGSTSLVRHESTPAWESQ